VVHIRASQIVVALDLLEVLLLRALKVCLGRLRSVVNGRHLGHEGLCPVFAG